MRKELAALEDKLRPLQMRYSNEKARLDELRRLQQKREDLLQKLEQAENRMDLAMVADIKYGALADINELLKKKRSEAPQNPMLTEVVRALFMN